MKKNAEKAPENKTAEEAVATPMPDKPETAPEQSSAEPEKSSAASGQNESAVRIAELEKMNADLNDQYLRKAADFDNYRKRMIREKQEAIDFANTNLLVDLVRILDDFDRAIQSGGAQDAGSPAAAFADGVNMIRNQLGTMLESKYGLAHYAVKGEPFDPHVHEAIGTIPSAEVQEPTVMEEFVKGYKLKDRVIRVAKVMVSTPAEAAAE